MPCSSATFLESGDSASTLAIMTLGSLMKSVARVSQVGARDLQSRGGC